MELKNLLAAGLAAFALGLASPVHAQDAEVDAFDSTFWSADDNEAWESDNWTRDEFGLYDEDYQFNTDDPWFDQQVDEEDYDWDDYDDAGDAGLFDV